MGAKKGNGADRARVVCLMGDGGQKLNYADQLRKDCPEQVADAILKARYWGERNGFLQTVLATKADFYNFGVKIVPAKGKADVEFKEWEQANAEQLYRFIDEVWEDRLIAGNVVAQWYTEDGLKTNLKVRTLPAERCRYDDAMGIEELKFRHELTPDQIRKLPEPYRTRYGKSNEITYSEEYGELFRVLKRARSGLGFGMPKMRAIFPELAQVEHMQVGENVLGLACRLVWRQHSIGHEIKGGARAGLATHFYNKATAKAIKAFFEGRTGLVDSVTNFDQSVKLHWVDPKLFDARKWDSPKARIVLWAGPSAVMFDARGVMPFLMPLFKAEAQAERRRVGLWLNPIVNSAFSPPQPCVVRWSNRCFNDSRTAQELLRFAVQQGAASLRTLNDETGLDHEEELDRKEAELKQEKLLLPLFDAAHGDRPGARSPASRKKDSGRPPGTPDPQGA